MLSFRRLGVCVIAAATLGTAGAASASLMSFVNVPVPAEAITDDPTLANHVINNTPAESIWPMPADRPGGWH